MRRLVLIMLVVTMALTVAAQRKITPVNTAATATQPINELADDTARINARMRATMAHYHDADGNVVYIDTITGREWRDSSQIVRKKPMVYPLLESASVSVDLWNPVMRAFGQHYGLIDFSASVSLHNRYKPVFETGLGLANNTPPDNNFTYKSPLSWYFRVGADYNFLYNSSTDYQFFAGLRVGFSPFSWSVTNIDIGSGYWDEYAHPQIGSIHSTACWWELALGLKVKLWGPISAGWTFRYHSILSESKNDLGQPWYIPGYGTRGSSISGSLSIYYTLTLNKKSPPAVNLNEGESDDTLYLPETPGQPTPEQITEGSDAQNPE